MYCILVDVTRCTGCERCVRACGALHGEKPADLLWTFSGDELSARRLCSVQPLGGGRFARKACMHCLEPSCVAACLVGGITKTPQGPVTYDPDKCIGCRYCMLACPHHIPRYEWDQPVPYMKKCDMCWERLEKKALPACVDACPTQALRFGERQELLRKAHEKIEGSPGRYLPRVWGETEWGGTSLLYISDVDLASLDWPPAASPAIPALTDPMIHETPFVGLGAALGLWALQFIITRRDKVRAAEAQDSRGD